MAERGRALKALLMLKWAMLNSRRDFTALSQGTVFIPLVLSFVHAAVVLPSYKLDVPCTACAQQLLIFYAIAVSHSLHLTATQSFILKFLSGLLVCFWTVFITDCQLCLSVLHNSVWAVAILLHVSCAITFTMQVHVTWSGTQHSNRQGS